MIARAGARTPRRRLSRDVIATEHSDMAWFQPVPRHVADGSAARPGTARPRSVDSEVNTTVRWTGVLSSSFIFLVPTQDQRVLALAARRLRDHACRRLKRKRVPCKHVGDVG